MWANRVVARGTDTPAHVILELGPEATVEEAQEAFHKVARTGHPDLHRASLTPDELELVTTAYARVAGAYQEYRTKRNSTQRMRVLKDEPGIRDARSPSDKIPALRPPARDTQKTPAGVPPLRPAYKTPEGMTPVTKPAMPTGTPAIPSTAPMNSKALLYYRKAEMCLRQGDLRTAVLNIKMAIAGDPSSTFLRTALQEIEAELAKK